VSESKPNGVGTIATDSDDNSSRDNRDGLLVPDPPKASPPTTAASGFDRSTITKKQLMPKPSHALSQMTASSAEENAPPPEEVPVARPAISIERLINEKSTILAKFEEKFNEKILDLHRELMEEQKRELESQRVDDKDHPLAKEVEQLKDDMEEQKFSHEVELSTQKKKVEKLEEELKRERERRGVTCPPRLHSKTPLSSAKDDLRINKLEEELRRERDLRISQLRSLEQLHFAEFREIEKKHAEFVSHLVASYRKEIKVLKNEILKAGPDVIKPEDKALFKSSKQQGSNKSASEHFESNEAAAAAAAALSSLASPSSNLPAKEESSSEILNIAIDVANLSKAVEDVTKAPPLSPLGRSNNVDMKPAKSTDNKKRNSTAITPAIAKPPPALEQNLLLEPSAKKMTNEGIVHKAKKIKMLKQKEQVEEILRKSGKVPPVRAPCVPTRKDGSKSEKKMLSDDVKDYLKNWMLSPEHCDHPYPCPEEKAQIMADTGISFSEMNNWFVNNRKRFWLTEVKPRIPEIKQAHRMKMMKQSYAACNAKNEES